MRIIISVLIVCLFIFLGGCEKSDTPESDLTGAWIEQAEKSDTIDFTTFTSNQVINLRRGSEFINEYWLPKYGSGFYAYYLTDIDSIALCHSLSSACISGLPKSYKKYYFTRVNENTFSISNFYNPDKSPEAIFTFSRIE
jgi:hypothetical protein